MPRTTPITATAIAPPAPRGLLAKRFLALLLENAGRPAARVEKRKTLDDLGMGFEELGLLDETDDPTTEAAEDIRLSVDVAAVGVLLADVFESDMAVLTALRKTSPVVLVQAPDARAMHALDTVLRICALGRSTTVVSERSLDELDTPSYRFDGRRGVILSCDVLKRDREKNGVRAVTALSLGVPVLALSEDIGRNAPPQLRSAADHVLVFGGWTPDLLATVIEAVTGEPIAVEGETWIRQVSMDDLRMSVSRQRGAAASLERLRRTVAKRLAQGTDLPAFETLAGFGDAHRVGLEMIADLRAFQRGTIGWSAVDRGLVLAGPPGTGKTLFARCLAAAAGLPMVLASLAQWQSAGEGHLGTCLSAMKRSFAEAKNMSPAILFIDELDSLGSRSTFDSRHRDYSTQVVNALLEELDGATDRSGVVVLAATNQIDRIDPAVLRSGRLDRVVHVGPPDSAELARILRTQLGDDLTGADLLPVAMAGRGGTGADAAAWVRRARGLARRAGRDLVVDDLTAAVREGRDELPRATRERIALHEAAHACATVALEGGKVQGVTLHDTGGATAVETSLRSITRREAVEAIVTLLAGRAAETAFLGSPSAGSGGAETSDLALATRIACGIEGSWGLGQAGPIWIGDADSFTAMMHVSAFIKPVRQLLVHGEAEAARLVTQNAAAIRRCAVRLLAEGYLGPEAVIQALGPIPRFHLRPMERDGDAVPDEASASI